MAGIDHPIASLPSSAEQRRHDATVRRRVELAVDLSGEQRDAEILSAFERCAQWSEISDDLARAVDILSHKSGKHIA